MKSRLYLSKPIVWLFCAFLGVAVVVSCKKEFRLGQQQYNREELGRLAQWYRANIKVTDENPFSKLEPIWSEVFVSEQQGQIIHEVSLLNPKKLTVLSEKGDKHNLDG